jgi:hypothetical protein
MRRISPALGCLVIAMACAATPVAAQAPTRDSVTGTAATTVPVSGTEIGITLFFDASSGPLGEDPAGTVTTDFGVGAVTCMRVEGNRAVVGTSTPFPQGPPGATINLLIFVVDQPFPDLIGIEPILGNNPPVNCPAPDEHGDLQTTTFGVGISVVDAQPPFPTSNDQCKNGGWRNFPQFKNQGQCIAFVNHGP